MYAAALTCSLKNAESICFEGKLTKLSLEVGVYLSSIPKLEGRQTPPVKSAQSHSSSAAAAVKDAVGPAAGGSRPLGGEPDADINLGFLKQGTQCERSLEGRVPSVQLWHWTCFIARPSKPRSTA